MKMKEIFALFIRTIGVVGVIYVINHILNAITAGQVLALPLIKQIAYLLVGLYFVGGAPYLLKFAYPEESKAPADNQAQPVP